VIDINALAGTVVVDCSESGSGGGVECGYTGVKHGQVIAVMDPVALCQGARALAITSLEALANS